jgi:hypothetical protein
MIAHISVDIRDIETRRMKWAGHVAFTEEFKGKRGEAIPVTGRSGP